MNPTLAHISDYLIRVERREPDVWYREDYRVAFVMVCMAEDGELPSYELAFLQLFSKHPSKVTWWWRDRRKLIRLSEETNCPTPLLVANRAEDILKAPERIPDYDPTLQISVRQKAVPREAA